jgi:uncharacterized protein YkwD
LFSFRMLKSTFWVLILSPVVVFSHSLAAENASKPESAAGAAVEVSQSSTPAGTDSQAEQELFDKANRERVKAGLPPLQMDEGLAQAAREHAAALAAEQQLSHQLPGEAPLAQRLATSTSLHLDRGGENVASAPTVEQAHESLMLSPLHRENLLNASYNVAGFGVVRSGNTLYVTQDFGQGSAVYSRQAADDRLATSLLDLRAQHNLATLERLENDALPATACSMAQANSLKTPLPREMAQGRYLLRYTTPQPQLLPASAVRAAADRGLHAFAASSCYARTASYPNGVYWVVLALY